MTADELSRLAEIACVELDKEDWSNNYIVWDDQEFEYYIWQPHLRIEQAMMVADKAFGFWQMKRVRYDGINWVYYFIGAYHSDHGILDSNGEGSTPSEAICRAALAAKEG